MKVLGSRSNGARLERISSSPRWLKGAFRNLHPISPGLRDPAAALPTVREFLYGGERRVPRGPLPSLDPLDGWRRRPASGLRATWLGHSTVLIEIDGLRVLTDPVWGPRASPSRFAGPKRFQPVPVSLKALPPLDAVILSHDHYDHLDYPTVTRLARHDVPFVTSLGVGAHLEAWGIPPARIVELDWWESHELPGGLRVTAAPSQHFSGRRLNDRNATLWSSFVVASDRHRVFFSGDTGLTSEYGAIRRRLGPFDLVMLEVGAFHPAWGDIHCWGAGRSSPCTGAPSASPCTPGTSRRRPCSRAATGPVCNWSCPGWASRWSRSASSASSPGGAAWIPCR